MLENSQDAKGHIHWRANLTSTIPNARISSAPHSSRPWYPPFLSHPRSQRLLVAFCRPFFARSFASALLHRVGVRAPSFAPRLRALARNNGNKRVAHRHTDTHTQKHIPPTIEHGPRAWDMGLAERFGKIAKVESAGMMAKLSFPSIIAVLKERERETEREREWLGGL